MLRGLTLPHGRGSRQACARLATRVRVRRRLAAGRSPATRLELLAAWCDDVARRLRLGASLHAAIAGGDTPPGLEGVARAAADGAAVADAALRAAHAPAPTARGRGTPHCDDARESVRFVLRTLAVASLGGPGAPHALERTATALRDRAAADADRRAHAAQAMLSMRVLTWLPVAVLAWLIATSDGARAFVLGSPRGWACVALGAVCNALGRRAMRRLVDRTA